MTGLARTISWYREFLSVSERDGAAARADSAIWWSEYCAEPFPRASRSCRARRRVPVSGNVFDGAEMRLLVDSSLDFWLTTGRFADAVRDANSRAGWASASAVLVNSGSSANLLALTALTSPKLGDRRLQPGR